MVVSVQKFREIVFQFLYSRGFRGSDSKEVISLVMRRHSISRKSAWGIAEEAGRIWKEVARYDQQIAKHAHDFPLDRIGRVERALLQQAIDGLCLKLLPPKVVIAEAVRLAKKFSTPESGAFVNALLDAIYKEGQDARVETELAPL